MNTFNLKSEEKLSIINCQLSIKKIALTIALLAVCMGAIAQDTIRLTWKVEAASLTKQFRIVATAGETFTVDWGNGTTTETGTGYLETVSHTYTIAETYDVCITNNATNCEITDFSCGSSLVTDLDVSQNTKLRSLVCWENSLTDLDVSKNTELQSLSCGKNLLTELDVNQNTKLIGLYCYDNLLTELKVSQNTKLAYFDCYNNFLTDLDVSKNTVLEYLDCSNNSLTTLDLSAHYKLYDLYCRNNKLTSIDINSVAPLNSIVDIRWNHLLLTDIYPIAVKSAGGDQFLGPQFLPIEKREKLGTINFSSQADIDGTNTTFSVKFNDVDAISGTDYSIAGGVITFLKEGIFIIKMTNSKVNSYSSDPVDVYVPVLVLPQEAQVITFRWTGGDAKKFYLTATQNEDFYVSWGTGLVEKKTGTGSFVDYSQTYTNSMTYEVAIVGTPDCEFTWFGCNGQNLSELDVSKATELTILNCSSNSLTSLDVSQNTELTNLQCEFNSITALDVRQNTKLTYLQCKNNSLTSLNISGATALRELYCYDNRLPLSNLYALSEEQVYISYLGKQVLHPITVKIGVEQFEEESFFGGAYTQYDITPNNGYALLDGKITFNKLGVYEVKMTNDAIQSDPYHPAEVYVRVTVNETGIGVDELTIDNGQLTIYPNPTNGELRIKNEELREGNATITIYDMMGCMVYEKHLLILNSQFLIELNVSHLPAGIYFLRVGNRMAKFVKN